MASRSEGELTNCFSTTYWSLEHGSASVAALAVAEPGHLGTT